MVPQVEVANISITKTFDAQESYSIFQGTYKGNGVCVKEWKVESPLFKTEIVALRYEIFMENSD